MFTIFTYILAFTALVYSFAKDKQKTIIALHKALRAFLGLLPDFAAILALVGVLLTFISPQFVVRFVGAQTGFLGMLLSSWVGSITLIPGFIAFPLVKSLLDRGAGIMQMAVFVSTLMMVGFVTAPLEIRFLGKKETILRNVLSYFYSFIVALIIGWVVGS
ncbi:hypothetical protein SAMN00808754_2386 [Thermanaeromonas toyohensis ToBE]|uniref:Permease n=1 Tax=Thermanaeromonas toyohensis ToBE TaxID=698762 RepID=A0A1W1VZ33_9FIRM|nr:permease [Thermanaeromonas toyohensis]SMB98523.1 hypothetical protein SAMN00808754_2386 [Thermanaeromonas toyohensis ToBE]